MVCRGKNYTEKLHNDLEIRGYLKAKLQQAAISRIVIERAWNSVRVTLNRPPRPGHRPQGQGDRNDDRNIFEMAKGTVKIDIIEISSRKPTPSSSPKTSPCNSNAAFRSAAP